MSESLYELLGVQKTAAQADIKKAYRQLALRLHPDKNPGDEDAAQKFQALQKVYDVLGNPERRKLYDETGVAFDDDALTGQAFEDLKAYYRSIFKEVTTDDIDNFASTYRGSEDEAKDVISAFVKFGGNMTQLFEWVMLSDPEQDSHRFMEIIDEAIAKGDIQSTKAYSKWSTKVKSTPKPAIPLHKISSSKTKKSSGSGDSSSSALIAAIQGKRGAQADAFFDKLGEKYGGKQVVAIKGKKKAKEPSEDEFLAAQQRVMDRKDKSSKTKDDGLQPKKKISKK